DGRSHESMSLLPQMPLVKGALWIAHLGYFALVRLAQLSQAGVSLSFAIEGWGGELGGEQAGRCAQRAASACRAHRPACPCPCPAQAQGNTAILIPSPLATLSSASQADRRGKR